MDIQQVIFQSVDYKLINNIISNNTWSTVHVDGWDEFRNNRKTYSRLTKEEHFKIYKLHIENGMTKYELADMYGKTVKMIEKIFREQRKLYDNPVPSLNQEEGQTTIPQALKYAIGVGVG